MPRDPAAGGTALTEQVNGAYLTHKSSLLRFLTRTLGNSRDAEDVAHEAFARMLSLPEQATVDHPLALLKCIALNIIRDTFRRERYRRQQVIGLEEPLVSAQPEPDPEQVAAARQRLARLRDAIDDLPPRCREVFVLHKVHGLPHAEVARRLGISRNMVERHVIRAYAQLREVMNDTPSGVDKD